MPNITTGADAPILFEHRCKLCQLAKTHPDLFKDIHIQVLEVGSSMNRAMNYINHRIQTENLQLPPFNNQNFSVHFASHITIPERVITEVARMSPSPPALKDINPEIGSFVEDIVRRKVGNDVNDYLNLDSLRAQLNEKLELLDEIVESADASGNKTINMDAMGYYTTIAKEIRSCIVDLNKIRQSKQLMSTIIKSLIEKATFETVRQLSREYDQIKHDMVSQGVDPIIATRVDQTLRIKLAEIIAVTARAAIEDVTRTYKLA
jgi:hypothetical protein